MTWMYKYGSHTLNEDYVMVLDNYIIKRMCIDCKRKRTRGCAMGLYCDNPHVFMYWFYL